MPVNRSSKEVEQWPEEAQFPVITWPVVSDEEARADWEMSWRVALGLVRADEWGQAVQRPAKL